MAVSPSIRSELPRPDSCHPSRPQPGYPQFPLRFFPHCLNRRWQRWDLYDLLARCYGTAAGNYRLLGRPEQAYLLHPLWDSTAHHHQKNLKPLAAR